MSNRFTHVLFPYVRCRETSKPIRFHPVPIHCESEHLRRSLRGLDHCGLDVQKIFSAQCLVSYLSLGSAPDIIYAWALTRSEQSTISFLITGELECSLRAARPRPRAAQSVPRFLADASPSPSAALSLGHDVRVCPPVLLKRLPPRSRRSQASERG